MGARAFRLFPCRSFRHRQAAGRGGHVSSTFSASRELHADFRAICRGNAFRPTFQWPRPRIEHHALAESGSNRRLVDELLTQNDIGIDDRMGRFTHVRLLPRERIIPASKTARDRFFKTRRRPAGRAESRAFIRSMRAAVSAGRSPQTGRPEAILTASQGTSGQGKARLLLSCAIRFRKRQGCFIDEQAVGPADQPDSPLGVEPSHHPAQEHEMQPRPSLDSRDFNAPRPVPLRQETGDETGRRDEAVRVAESAEERPLQGPRQDQQPPADVTPEAAVNDPAAVPPAGGRNSSENVGWTEKAPVGLGIVVAPGQYARGRDRRGPVDDIPRPGRIAEENDITRRTRPFLSGVTSRTSPSKSVGFMLGPMYPLRRAPFSPGRTGPAINSPLASSPNRSVMRDIIQKKRFSNRRRRRPVHSR